MNQKQKIELLKGLLVFLVATIFIWVVIFTSNSSSEKAIQKCQQQIETGNICSGYHFEKAEGKYYIYFRNPKTNEITKIVETISKDVADKFYKGE